MRRTRSLHALFATLVSGCGPVVSVDDDGASASESDSDTSPTTGMTTSETDVSVTDTYDDTYYDSGCDEPGGIEVFEVPRSDIEQWLDARGQIEPNHCWEVCWLAGIDGDVIDCGVLVEPDDEPVPPEEPEPGTTGDETGGDESGDDSTGDSTGEPGTTGEEEWVVVQCEWQYYCGGGRGHAALQPATHPSEGDAVARWAAATAHAEAASVAAFLALRDELEFHDAPADLVARALEAARDEVAHARMMSRIANRRGATPQRPRFAPIEVRALEALAIENAVEGCVRETWAALEATYQARAAHDTDIRAAMSRIALDETRHAELARDIDAWLRTRLDAKAIERVDAARNRAADALAQSLDRQPDSILHHHAGLPSSEVARRLLNGLQASLWN